MTRLRDAIGLGALLAYVLARGLFRRPKPLSLDERLAMLPVKDAPVGQPVAIYWNEHQIPFIEARSDDDLAVALGIVHAHLRLGQMEMMRRVALGRVAEAVGPAGIEIDRAVRLIGIARAVPAIEASLSERTRRWLGGFVEGVNHQLATARRLPYELDLLGLRPEPWTIADLLTVGRLASADLSWMIGARLLALRDRVGEEHWPALWERLLEDGAAPLPSLAGAGGPAFQAIFASLLHAFGKTGSNSLAVSSRRSATGNAMIASDPHLSVSLPNLWLIAGYRSPSYHAVGLMIPGLPFLALGRNPWIAWGGTNLHAASSDFYEVAGLPRDAIAERRETIRVRWWGRSRLKFREAPQGPVVSDSVLFRQGPAVALRWVGHRPSDEIGAMLAVNRAQGWGGFRTALNRFAIPGQTMIYADAQGCVGKVTAAHLPRRPAAQPSDVTAPSGTDSQWETLVTGSSLPSEFDPARGFVASANDRPPAGSVPVGFFFSSNDRIERLKQLLGRNDRVRLEHLRDIQQDVFLASALVLRDFLMPRLTALAADEATTTFVEAIARWDGHYRPYSVGALAFELLLFHLVRQIVPAERLSAYGIVWTTRNLVAADLGKLSVEQLDAALGRALAAAQPNLAKFGSWGGMHRLRIAHILAGMPAIGKRFVYDDLPVGGTNETVMKAAHGLSGDRHATRYGACARHVSDLGDLDDNQFCLLGGQDGWIGSSTFMDQVPLWQRGELIQVPLALATVRRKFTRRTRLLPKSP